MKYAVLLASLFILLALGVADAEDITLNAPAAGDTCVLGEHVNYSYTPNVAVSSCYLYANDTGVMSLKASNVSAVANQLNFFYGVESSANIVGWYVRCVNSSLNDLFSANQSYTLKNVAYCAVLSETLCPFEPNVNSMAVGRTRIGNSRGFWLENQDANVYVTRTDTGAIVKAFDTMTIGQQVTLILDPNTGQWLNTLDKKIPLSDANGYYIFPFLVDSNWAWVGYPEYQLNFNLNGQSATCRFNVTKTRLPDTENLRLLGVDASGVILLILILLYLIWRYGGAIMRGVW